MIIWETIFEFWVLFLESFHKFSWYILMSFVSILFWIMRIFKIVCSYCLGIGGVHSNIKILDLSHNNISIISKQFFKPVELSITHIYLGFNDLLNATREVFGNLRHLQWLDLSHNRMYELDFDMFRNTKKLQVKIANSFLLF